MTDLGKTYSLEVEVLSPVHIGCGSVLKKDLDYVVQGNRTYRLNEEAVFEQFWPEDGQKQYANVNTSPVDFLAGVDLSKHPKLALYSFAGQPSLGEVREHIKDVYGRAYIPGSSLKGAIRTLILRTMIEGVRKAPLTRADIGPGPRSPGELDRAAKNAAAPLEREYGGPDPNHSLFRGLQIGDTSPVDPSGLRLQRIQMRKDLDIDVEAIAIGTKLRASLRVDRRALRDLAETFGMDVKMAQTVERFARAANFTAEQRVRHERQHHERQGHTRAVHFYNALLKMITGPDFGKTSFLLQVGFATGWASKTLIGGLPPENPLIAQVVNDFELNKGGKRGAKRDDVAPLAPGDTFPGSRHLAYYDGAPNLPLGWLKVTYS